jgi:putative restriction endonuclease
MIKKFDEDPSDELRAFQIWLILIGKAFNRQIVTYKILGKMLGFRGYGVFAGILDHIRIYCILNHLPPLTALVVNQITGLPGKGLGLSDKDLNAAREKIYNYDWYNIIPPTPEQLMKERKIGIKKRK